MSDRNNQNKDELLRKAREYVEKHEQEGKQENRRHSSSGDNKRSHDKKTKRKRKEHDDEKEKVRRHRKRRDIESDQSGDEADRRKKSTKHVREKKRSKDEDRKSHGRSKNDRRGYKNDDSLRSPSDDRSEESRGRYHDRTSRDSKRSSKEKHGKKGHRSSDRRSSKNRSNRSDDDKRNRRNRSRSRSRSSERTSRDKGRHRQKKDNRKDERKNKHVKKESRHHDRGSNSNKDKTTSKIDRHDMKKLATLLGPITKKTPSKPINSDRDYFAYHNHLRLYIYHSNGTYFEDLSSEETHQLFKKFCDKYNAGDLEEAYYDEKLALPDEAMEICKRTKHKWNFNTNVTEQKSLDLIKSGVKKQTEYQTTERQKNDKSGPMLCAPTSNNYNNTVPKRERPMIPERKIESVTDTTKANQDKIKQEAMIKMLGLGIKAGQKITIAPRK